MRVVFKTRLRLRVWREMPAAPPGIVPGEDEMMHWDAAWMIYHALKWIVNPALVPGIVAGRMTPIADRLRYSIKRTGEVR